MTDLLQSVAARLGKAAKPQDLDDWESRDGFYVETCRVSRDDVPALIELIGKWSDLDWPRDNLDLGGDPDDIGMLPVTAWRVLADLRAEEAVEPLIGWLREVDEGDDWIASELPSVFGKIGAPAIPALGQLAKNTGAADFGRMIAAASLSRIAEFYPETRDQVVGCLTELMTHARDEDVPFNSIVLDGLVSLGAVEAAEAIERAFSANRLDVGLRGDWEDVRRELRVEGPGLEIPEHPDDSTEPACRRMGGGIFSDRALYDESGEFTGAEHDYYERALGEFSQSEEAREFTERFGAPGWSRMLLEFVLDYHGEVVDEMTVASVRQFVLYHVPRKVSAEPDQAPAIVLELTKFWQYIDRVYGLPEAKSIIAWLESDGLAAQLAAELSNPANFGMAKSFFMAGQAAGYDMTSQEDRTRFMDVYNESIRQVHQTREMNQAPPPEPTQVATPKLERQRVGRNEPCPCGSGKKYKKCCMRR